jgi:hypothetical protein
MYKVLKADKDTYITNRFIKTAGSGSFRTGSNVGSAGTLDLFKLYGVTLAPGSADPNLELSRLLIHFDLQPLKDLITQGKLNSNKSNFNCTLKLFDVYGGQTTPANFDVFLFPLSKSFDEGLGRDVVYYSDFDAANFISSSLSDGAWLVSGCGFGGGAEQSCDYITASTILGNTNLAASQHFATGEEDLNINVTTIVSATLAGILPDSGFRLSLGSQQESDRYSYFVKRFSSRTAYDTSKHPHLIIKYDDSVQDDSQILKFNSNSSIFLRNYEFGEPSNILSGSSLTAITGSNSLLLRLVSQRSDGSGSYSLYFTGSQHSDGLNFITGLYSASFTIPSTDVILKDELIKSGSVIFTPIWTSLDKSVAYFTGSNVTAYPPERSNKAIDFKNYVVSTSGLQTLHRSDENVLVRVNIFDHTSPYIKLTKRPIELPGIVTRKAYYQVRDITTNETVIPFDKTYNSSRLSSDYDGMYFNLDISNLVVERSYVIDIMLNVGGTQKIFKSVSNVFKVSDIQTV